MRRQHSSWDHFPVFVLEKKTFHAKEALEDAIDGIHLMAEEAEASTPDPQPEAKFFEGWSPWVGSFKVKL